MTDFTDILSIAGKGGLHKLVGKSKSSIIVENLDTGKRYPVFGTQQVSSLEEISVFTHDDDMPLKDVLKAIYTKEDGGLAPDLGKDSVALRSYFTEAVPDFDEERVYLSDIRKILRWYNDLHKHGLLDFTEEEVSEEAPEAPVDPATEDDK